MEHFDATSFSHVRTSVRGFTLLEMLVVVTMVGILFVVVALAFNPAAQIAKAQNATRQHDIEQIRTAVDTYYDDTGCYPTSVSFGQEFSSNGKVYMTKIPEDPNCQGNGDGCYVYQTDTTSSCPQWNVLYAKLASPLSTSITCPLINISQSCIPTNYQSLGFNYCVISGNIDCSTISSVAVTPVPPSTLVPTPTSSPGNGAPTSTPTPVLCGTYYACTGMGANGCNVLDVNSSQNCTQNGGNMACYCNAQCSNQCQ